MKSLQTSRFFGYFRNADVITIQDLKYFYSIVEGDITNTTLHWRIHKLISLNLLSRVSRGMYSLSTPKQYIPEINLKSHKTRTLIQKKFLNKQFHVWDNEFIKELLPDKAMNSITVVECEKQLIKDVHYYLRDNHINSLMKPSGKLFYELTEIIRKTVIVLPLISEAPLLQNRDRFYQTPEKLFPDLLSYPFIAGIKNQSEFIKLYKAIAEKHTFNHKSMLRYATRRNKIKELISLLNSANSIS